MSDPIDVTDIVVSTISEQVPDLTDAQVQAVLAAWNNVRAGDPVGTVRRSTAGAVGHRVAVDGVHLWRVTEPGGSQYNDMQPTLSWPVLYQIEEQQ